jgi:hypothetical protein
MIDLDALDAAIVESERRNMFTAPIVKDLIAELREARGERAAVVAYLHHRANLWLNAEKVQRTEASMGLWLVCQAIERGEHRREVTDANR